ncbi:MAG: hypothetical protein RMM16_00005, partial [Chloroherpetonaceae bacterium]|nr:hypothetical protein [Chloroherpetonaceae bacterium]
MNAEQRLTDLETALAEYIKQNALAQERSETEFKRFREEMLAFKNEIREDTRRLKEEMATFKDEMLAFKNEIREDTRRLKE